MRAQGRVVVTIGLLGVFAAPVLAQQRRIRAVQPTELRNWDDRIAAKLRTGELSLRKVSKDTLLEGREHQRFDQVYKGVPVFGGELVRQLDGARTVSVFGTLYEGI